MKNILLILAAFVPVLCNAQNFYLQAGSGYQFASSNSKNGYALELSSGIKINPFLRLGIGVSYLKEDQAFTSGYIPVYADLKLIGKGKIKPYVFLQPGYGVYKSPTIYFTDFNGDLIGTGHTMGGFSSNQGIGLIYKFVFLQAGYRIQNFSLKTPENITDSYSQNTFGITAGLALPW
jgi:Outer membrane protein beta-barrel domain